MMEPFISISYLRDTTPDVGLVPLWIAFVYGVLFLLGVSIFIAVVRWVVRRPPGERDERP